MKRLLELINCGAHAGMYQHFADTTTDADLKTIAEALAHSVEQTSHALRKASVTPVTLERTYKIEMFSTIAPVLGWFDMLEDAPLDDDLDSPPLRARLFTSRKEARGFIDKNQLEGHGCELRIVPA
jgi:hypothetical protein